MPAKLCRKCGETKPLAAFSKRGKHKRQSHCKECNRAYCRAHYKRNKQRYLDAHRTHRDRLKRRLDALREAACCADCGEEDPVVLDFDHRPGEKKLAAVPALAHAGNSWAVIAREIAKCDIVCSNCHRRRTASRLLLRRQTGKAT